MSVKRIEQFILMLLSYSLFCDNLVGDQQDIGTITGIIKALKRQNLTIRCRVHQDTAISGLLVFPRLPIQSIIYRLRWQIETIV